MNIDIVKIIRIMQIDNEASWAITQPIQATFPVNMCAESCDLCDRLEIITVFDIGGEG